MPSEQVAQWVVFAVASGGCAALNGAFAKLVTNDLTTTWSAMFSSHFGLEEYSAWVELLIRGVCSTRSLPCSGLRDVLSQFLQYLVLPGAQHWLQCCDVGTFHQSLDVGQQHGASQCNQHKRKLCDHSTVGRGDLQREIARFVGPFS